ncbi:Rad1/Rec1/Rad17 [Dipodascopsis uninucleata]
MVTVDEETEAPVLDAVSTCVSYIYRLLKAVSTVSSRAQIQISSDGLRVSAENSRSCEAHVFLNKSLFSSFTFRPDNKIRSSTQQQLSQFSRTSEDGRLVNSSASDDAQDDGICTLYLSLSSLVDCFQIFGSDGTVEAQQRGKSRKPGSSTMLHADVTSIATDDANPMRSYVGGSSVCKLQYRGSGCPFVLMFDEGTLTTTCEFITYDEENEEDMSSINLATDALLQKVIMKAEYLDDAFRELYSSGSEFITIESTPNPAGLTFKTRGELGSVEYAFPKDRNVLETFLCPIDCSNVYAFGMLLRMRDAIKLASKISLRSDEYGIMSIQCMCDVGDGRQSFIDFKFVPIYDDEYESTNRALLSNSYREQRLKLAQTLSDLDGDEIDNNDN